jgi:hypothetical protein
MTPELMPPTTPCPELDVLLETLQPFINLRRTHGPAVGPGWLVVPDSVFPGACSGSRLHGVELAHCTRFSERLLKAACDLQCAGLQRLPRRGRRAGQSPARRGHGRPGAGGQTDHRFRGRVCSPMGVQTRKCFFTDRQPSALKPVCYHELHPEQTLSVRTARSVDRICGTAAPQSRASIRRSNARCFPTTTKILGTRCACALDAEWKDVERLS